MFLVLLFDFGSHLPSFGDHWRGSSSYQYIGGSHRPVVSDFLSVTGGQKVFSWRREEVCSLALESFLAVDVNFHPISGSDQSASSDYEKQH